MAEQVQPEPKRQAGGSIQTGTGPGKGLNNALPAAVASATLLVLLTASFLAGARYGSIVLPWLGVPWVTEHVLATASNEPADVAPTFSLFWEAWNIVSHDYVDRSAINPQSMTYGAIDGMVTSLGDTGHSRFLTPADLAREQDELKGSLVGIGIEVELRNGEPVIAALLKSSPAGQAGLQPGDVIVRVNGDDVTRLDLWQLMVKMAGEAGTPVRLGVIHPGSAATTDVTVVRQKISVQPVTEAAVPRFNITDIQLSDFDSQATADLRQVLQRSIDGHTSGIVLDLRNNPGGLLDQAVDVASQFMSTGTVVVERDRSGQERAIAAKPGGAATTVPLAVLIDRGTASSAEIVAAALKDNKRATLVGQATFGTGTILSTYQLRDGSAILLGTSDWLTPDRQLVKGQGVQPDIPVRLTSQSSIVTPTRLNQLSQDQVENSGDGQLLAALGFLQSRVGSNH